MSSKKEDFSTTLELIYKYINEIMLFVDDSGEILYESTSICKILGFSKKNSIGNNILDRIHVQDRSEFMKILNEMTINEKGHKQDFTCKILHNDGRWVNIEITFIGIVKDLFFDGIILTVRNQKKKQKIINSLEFRHYLDMDSYLINKKVFKSYLNKEIIQAKQKKRKLIVMALSFKYFINEQEVEIKAVSSEILSMTGMLLKKLFRLNDVICRISLDEYFIIFNNINSSDNVEIIVRKTTEYFSTHFFCDGKSISIIQNIGLVFFPFDGSTADDIFRNCKLVLSKSKEGGVNLYEVCNENNRDKIVSSYILEDDIASGLEKEEFILHYQPKVDSFGKIIGLEALIRWQSPSRGYLYPDNFIPISEQSGQILSIDKYVINKVCRQIKIWKENNYKHVPVSINISPYSFENTDILSYIDNSIKEFGLSPGSLDIEVLESGLMENVTEITYKFQKIHEMGIRIAIDDFGKGYSCLSKLRDYHIDILKIDKSFVDNLAINTKAEIIIESIIFLSRKLDLEIIAEGVETREQFKTLEDLGCTIFQGYFFGKPMEAQMIEKHLGQYNLV